MASKALMLLGLLSSGAYAATCEPVNLSDPDLLPARSQLYANGGEKDSRYCYAYALAGLLGKVLGKPVEPRELAIQHLRNTKTSDEMHFPLNFGWGGDIRDNFAEVRGRGVCAPDAFRAFEKGINPGGELDWYLALRSRILKHGREDFYRGVDLACGDRTPIPEKVSLEVRQAPFSTDASGEEPMAMEMKAKIDTELEAGRPVVLSYAFHYVLITGRTADCEYTVQDSIPASYREKQKEGFPKYYSKTKGEHIQFWSERNLLQALRPDRVNFPASVLPSIAFVKVDASALRTGCEQASPVSVPSPFPAGWAENIRQELRPQTDHRP